jgi:hypothetical protein
LLYPTELPGLWTRINQKARRCLAIRIGGAEEDRTPDLRIANATLSQLSYGPVVSEMVIKESSGPEF